MHKEGSSRIGPEFRIILIKTVQEKFQAEVGDLVVFWEDDGGNVS